MYCRILQSKYFHKIDTGQSTNHQEFKLHARARITWQALQNLMFGESCSKCGCLLFHLCQYALHVFGQICLSPSLSHQISLMPAYGIPFVGLQWILVDCSKSFCWSSLHSLQSLIKCIYRACAQSLSYIFSRESVLKNCGEQPFFWVLFVCKVSRWS